MSATLAAYRRDVLRDVQTFGPTTAQETANRTGLTLTQAGMALRWHTHPTNGQGLTVDLRDGRQAPLYTLAEDRSGVRAWRRSA